MSDQRLVEICDEFVDGFQSDGESDEAVGDACPFPLVSGDIGVRHGRGMRHERLNGAKVLGESNEFQPFHA